MNQKKVALTTTHLPVIEPPERLKWLLEIKALSACRAETPNTAQTLRGSQRGASETRSGEMPPLTFRSSPPPQLLLLTMNYPMCLEV